MKLRILLANDSVGHTRGYYLIAQTLREAGMEVILGGVQMPREIAITSIQEDVDVIGYHIMCGEPKILVQELFKELKKRGAAETPVVIGGIVPPWQISELEQMGVKKVFLPGSSLRAIIEFFRTSFSLRNQ
jgi:methylmalonyl-CoA mutase C-terminal domain/subunit